MKKKDILKYKSGNVLLVCGTGPSILDREEEIKEYTKIYDSIGIDWFCKSRIPTKYYFVRDQVHHSSMISHDDNETIGEFSSLINNFYKNSNLLISKLNKIEFDDYYTRWDWGRKSSKLNVKNKIIISEQRTSSYSDMKKDFFHICYRYSYDFFCVLQFAATMGYSNLFLIGFDLNDNKCFWNKDLRVIQKKRGLTVDDECIEYNAYNGMLNYWKNNFHNKIFCLDKNSKIISDGLGVFLSI